MQSITPNHIVLASSGSIIKVREVNQYFLIGTDLFTSKRAKTRTLRYKLVAGVFDKLEDCIAQAYPDLDYAISSAGLTIEWGQNQINFPLSELGGILLACIDRVTDEWNQPDGYWVKVCTELAETYEYPVEEFELDDQDVIKVIRFTESYAAVNIEKKIAA